VPLEERDHWRIEVKELHEEVEATTRREEGMSQAANLLLECHSRIRAFLATATRIARRLRIDHGAIT
jgi:hypothetical protein